MEYRRHRGKWAFALVLGSIFGLWLGRSDSQVSPRVPDAVQEAQAQAAPSGSPQRPEEQKSPHDR